MKRVGLALALVLVLAAAGARGQDPGGKANPGSLYAPGGVNPLHDRIARRVGDLLLVLVDETTAAKYAAKTNATKSDSTSFAPEFVKSLLSRLFRPLSVSNDSKVSGDGSTQVDSSMQTQMSVVIKQVLPGGNLFVEGRRTLVTNKDTQTLVLRGIVRPEDISRENTVKSAQIAEAEIRMEGRGMIADRQRRGLITQLLDWLF